LEKKIHNDLALPYWQGNFDSFQNFFQIPQPFSSDSCLKDKRLKHGNFQTDFSL